MVTFGRQHVRGGWLRDVPRNSATGPHRREAGAAVPPGSARRLATGDLTFRKPFTAAGFGNWFKVQRHTACGAADCTAHGLRKLGATLAAENGATVHPLMAIFD